MIDRIKKEFDEYRDTTYAEYLTDKAVFATNRNEYAVKYAEEFTEKLSWQDEDYYNEYVRRYCEQERIQPDGSYLSLYNPNSKWDWYCIGGRWSDSIPLKDGTFCDEANMIDVDIDYCDEEDYEYASRLWELYIEHRPPINDEEKDMLNGLLYKESYYTSRYSSKQDYAYDYASFIVHSALLPDGTWHEAGEMGWFGCDSSTPDTEATWGKEWRDILHLAQTENWHIVLVDCHI